MNRHGERDHQYDLLWSCEIDALTMIFRGKERLQDGSDERHHTRLEYRVRIRDSATSRLSVDIASDLNHIVHFDSAKDQRRYSGESER
jgi:hypothetical protein